MKQRIRVGIVGGAGYTAGELIRLLLNHPAVDLRFVLSESSAGKPLWQIHEGLYGETDMCFADTPDFEAVDLLFMCSAHGHSREFLQANPGACNLAIVDLAQDFRDESEGFVYGLPEMNRERIVGARRVANPGCFATAIQLALLPLAAAGRLTSAVEITGITGSTGAGVRPGASTHFSWRDNNLSVYKAFNHQHLAEIGRSLAQASNGIAAPELHFVPVRGDFPRGIFVMAHLATTLSVDEARDLYNTYYADAAFTHVMPVDIDLKQAVNTNKAIIGLQKQGDRLLVTSAIDNLLKGASGQAVQNMNLMFGLDEREGLRLKPSAF